MVRPVKAAYQKHTGQENPLTQLKAVRLRNAVENGQQHEHHLQSRKSVKEPNNRRQRIQERGKSGQRDQ